MGSGLGLSKAVTDNLGRYTQTLLEIVRNQGELAERNRLLGESPATALHTWATSVAPPTLDPQQAPIITE